jgi:hypothetical protein
MAKGITALEARAELFVRSLPIKKRDELYEILLRPEGIKAIEEVFRALLADEGGR